MKKHLLFAIVAVVLATINVKADQLTFGKVIYQTVNQISKEFPQGYAYVDGLSDDNTTEIIIKSSIEYDGHTYPVIFNRGSVLYWRQNLVSVTIEDGIKNIPDWTFGYCVNLKSIKLPSTLTSIGESAFYECNNLTDISLPQSLTDISYNAFNNCRSLISVTVPMGIKKLNDQVFANCTSMQRVYLSDSLVSIGNSCFVNCNSLQRVHLSDSLVSIGNSCFANCYSLDSVVIPASVQNMGSWAFGSCNNLFSLRMNPVNPPSNDYLPDNLYSITVPKGSADAYNSIYPWNSRIIINGEPLELSIDVATPGTLGDQILTKTTNLRDVNKLILSGTLNDVDIDNVRNRLTGLVSVDMSGLNMTALPENFFNNRRALSSVVFPNSLISIGNSALSQCYSLQNIDLPKTLTYMGNSAFSDCHKLRSIEIPSGISFIANNTFSNCYSLQSVKFNEGLRSINYAAFSSNSSLDSLTFPSTLLNINSSAFSSCSRLSKINFNEGLTTIEDYAFYDCNNLKEVILPSTIVKVNYSFYSCDNISNFYCRAAVAPKVYNNNPMSGVDMTGKVLYVPALAINQYKQTNGWDAFAMIQPMVYEPSVINVHNLLSIQSSARPTNKPDLNLFGFDNEYAKMTINGTDMFSVNKFSINNTLYYNYYNWGDYIQDNPYNTLLNYATMRADSVVESVNLYRDRWHFVTFPYDVKVSSIIAPANTKWALRTYSGLNRAKILMDSTWINLSSDSIMHSGTGYIIMCSGDNEYNTFAFPAINNTNKNQIFSVVDRTLPLNEYLSDFGHNRSWNLIGNPYPCFFDTRLLSFTAPITTWNGYTYVAYSPVDDSYILHPNEAFFVQRPIDQSSITFSVEGRQLTADVIARQNNAKHSFGINAKSTRSILNILLSGENVSDKTRIVINNNATLTYDMACDATKFMSTDLSVPQIYSINDDVDFSINERPLSDGTIILGTYFGSKGKYTIFMTANDAITATLVDKETGSQQDLNNSSYSFDANSGTYNNRFLVRLEDVSTSISASKVNSPNITVSAGEVTVDSPLLSEINIYTADGTMVSRQTAQHASFALKAGFYLIKVNGVAYKINVPR